MGLPQLDNLVRIRQLKSEPPTQAEIDGLMRSGNVRLKDAQILTLSLDSRFDLGYNAAHAFSLAALRWHGYRSEHRYTVFQCLQHTTQMSPQQWRVLDNAHRKRNVAEYEGYLTSQLSFGFIAVADRYLMLGIEGAMTEERRRKPSVYLA